MDSRKVTHFGRYQVLAELGRGAMGLVYKARDPQIDRLVAVKTISLLNQGTEEELEYRKRFFLEARAAGRLSHPGIVTIYDVGEDPSTHTPYIVMEYVAGESLNNLLGGQQGRMPLKTALQLAQDLAEALDYAHAQGVVHRDIKPANILVTEDGHAKITDFGIAKLNLALMTVPGHVLGTPAYMSPEQLEGQELDGRSDLFSLGVILYAMLTGHRPFQGNSATTVCFKVANREPLPASTFDTSFPPELDYVIARCMAKDRTARYQTGRELALDLSSLLKGQAPRSQGDSASPTGEPAQPSALSTVAREMAEIRSATTQLHQRRISAFLSPLRLLEMLRHQAPAILTATAVFVLLFSGVWIIRQKPFATPGTPPPSSSVISTTPKSLPVPDLRQLQPITSAALAKQTKRAPEMASLQLQLMHHFKSGTVSVWSDNRLVYTHEIHGEPTKKLVVFRGVQGKDLAKLRVPAGSHQLRVRVQSQESTYDQSAEIVATLRKDAEQVLSAKCDKQRLALVLQ
ncbi:MAG TPA: serine/threonine-protein kinase [Terriglobales bacterium]|nr:serine/threonine-protein kinase [Terriglobales bacterium]